MTLMKNIVWLPVARNVNLLQVKRVLSGLACIKQKVEDGTAKPSRVGIYINIRNAFMIKVARFVSG